MRKVIHPNLGQGIKGKAVSGRQGSLKRDSWGKGWAPAPSWSHVVQLPSPHQEVLLSWPDVEILCYILWMYPAFLTSRHPPICLTQQLQLSTQQPRNPGNFKILALDADAQGRICEGSVLSFPGLTQRWKRLPGQSRDSVSIWWIWFPAGKWNILLPLKPSPGSGWTF